MGTSCKLAPALDIVNDIRNHNYYNAGARVIVGGTSIAALLIPGAGVPISLGISLAGNALINNNNANLVYNIAVPSTLIVDKLTN